MSYRLLGAILIVTGCGGFGISMVSQEKHHEKLLCSLITAIQHMKWELQFRLTPLPQLLMDAGKTVGGDIGRILKASGHELSNQLMPDAVSCMQKVLSDQNDLPRNLRFLLRKLSSCLGNYDLPGQLEGLEAVEQACKEELQKLDADKYQRYKGYRTLGFCTGAALAILFI